MNNPFSQGTPELNVLGEPLQPCSTDPMTGFFRNGGCLTGPDDVGRHLVCAVMSAEFLKFSKAAGNDLSTPAPQYAFPGLKPGDRWCLVAMRWQEAFEAGMAPKVALLSTHVGALNYVKLDDLKRYAIDLS
ncbi:DUF2237 family protein [Devosia sp.]|uniref:DUF2237 family protein n=1 Tax=Devosia sp. TaxID=1871048 RepID=UPI0037BEEF9F